MVQHRVGNIPGSHAPFAMAKGDDAPIRRPLAGFVQKGRAFQFFPNVGQLLAVALHMWPKAITCPQTWKALHPTVSSRPSTQEGPKLRKLESPRFKAP
jgi:hypothetical protein